MSSVLQWNFLNFQESWLHHIFRTQSVKMKFPWSPGIVQGLLVTWFYCKYDLPTFLSEAKYWIWRELPQLSQSSGFTLRWNIKLWSMNSALFLIFVSSPASSRQVCLSVSTSEYDWVWNMDWSYLHSMAWYMHACALPILTFLAEIQFTTTPKISPLHAKSKVVDGCHYGTQYHQEHRGTDW